MRVLAQGTFDLLHPGHVYYLSHARKLGNHLTVIVARDATSMRVKGKKPTVDEKTRLKMVQSLKVVDKAVLGRIGNVLDRVVEIHPDVIALGYDQHIAPAELRSALIKRGLACRVVRIAPFQKNVFKSSKIKHRILSDIHQNIST